MVDLRNRNLVKIMWLPGDPKVVWDMKSELQIPASDPVYNLFNQYMDLNRWSLEYEHLYHKWLEGASRDIYNLSHQLNLSILRAIGKVNSHQGSESNRIIFYWYDKDRTLEKTFTPWKRDPILGGPLLDLGENYHYLNRLISLDSFLVLPQYSS